MSRTAGMFMSSGFSAALGAFFGARATCAPADASDDSKNERPINRRDPFGTTARKDNDALAQDAQWVAALHVDDEHALREIMDAHFDRVANLALRYVGSKDIASDIAQDTFVRLWKQRHHLTSDTVVRAYISRVARNLALDLLRHSVRAADLARRVTDDLLLAAQQNENRGVAQVETDEFHAMIRTIADTLTPRVRDVLLLYYEEQLEPNEIAVVLGVSPKTVYAQLRTALQTYAKALVGRWP